MILEIMYGNYVETIIIVQMKLAAKDFVVVQVIKMISKVLDETSSKEVSSNPVGPILLNQA